VSPYTYIYVGQDTIPYYVGEGSRRRYLDEHRVPVPPRDHILRFEHSTKEAAQIMEMFLIHQIGRLDLGTGPLLNLTDGGPGAKNPCASHREAMRKVGRKNVESGHIFGVATPESCAKGGRVGGRTSGRKNAESGHLARIAALGRTPESCAKGGRIGGRKAVESGHLARIAAFGGRIGGRISGRKNVESGQLAEARKKIDHQKRIHIRWHVKRGIKKEGCALCQI